MFGLGIGEGLIILAIVILLFGGKKLPQLAKSLGKSMNSFKEGLNESKEQDKDTDKKNIDDNSKNS